jgi:hypothetical protein
MASSSLSYGPRRAQDTVYGRDFCKNARYVFALIFNDNHSTPYAVHTRTTINLERLASTWAWSGVVSKSICCRRCKYSTELVLSSSAPGFRFKILTHQDKTNAQSPYAGVALPQATIFPAFTNIPKTQSPLSPPPTQEKQKRHR